MGIPFFFKYLFNKYKDIITQVKDGKRPLAVKIDNYFIDLNAIIHPVCQKFYPREENVYKPKRLLHNTQQFPISNKMIYSEVCKELENRISIIQPQKRIYIAIDGVAGVSKITQQRQRRFMSVKSKTDEEFKKFDSNSITAGTEFMNGLSRYIDVYLKRKIQTWTHLTEIIFSNDRHPGEGEHKLIDYIRKFFDILLQNKETICIDSPDADLFMLALGTKYPYIYIFRNNIYNFLECKYFLVDINQLKINLLEELKQTDDTDDNIIDDFLFISMWFGNDFVANIHCLEMNQENMDTLLSIYFNTKYEWNVSGSETSGSETKNGKNRNNNIIIKHNETYCINVKFLKQYLYNISVNEVNFFKNK
jgi:5'-3' exoribonuclease 1